MFLKKKRTLLLGSLLGIFSYFIFRNSVATGICDSLEYSCRTLLDSLERTFFFFFFLLFFSLLTFKLPEVISRTWIKYALVASPIVLLISLYINLGLHHDPAGDWQNIFDSTALWALYILFSLGSLIAMWLGWRKGR